MFLLLGQRGDQGGRQKTFCWQDAKRLTRSQQIDKLDQIGLLSADIPFGTELFVENEFCVGRKVIPFWSFLLFIHLGSFRAQSCIEVAGRIAGSSWSNECKVGVREFWTVHFPNHIQDWIYLCRTGRKLKLPKVSGATDHVLGMLNTILLVASCCEVFSGCLAGLSRASFFLNSNSSSCTSNPCFSTNF